MFKKIFFLVFLFSNVSFGALAPLYHSAKEIKDLLDEPKLAINLGVGEEIMTISRMGKKIVIKTRNCTLEVKSTIINIDRPEAPEFNFEFGIPSC